MPRRPLVPTLSASTTELPGVPASVPAGARREAAEGSRARWAPTAGRFYAGLILAALIVGGLSLLIPSTPSYDPWAWIVWGREIIHLNLQTTGGPSWKPLPMIFTIPFALFGNAAPNLWLVIARAGAFAAIVMVFRMAARLTRRICAGAEVPAWVVYLAALVAGLVALDAITFSAAYLSDNALGYSEGLATAIILVALDRHLDGHHRQTFAIGFFAALDRPEIWLFWGPYGLWLFWRDPGARKLVVSLLVLIPICWFLPEYAGSGHFLRGVTRAQHPRSNSLAFARIPFLAELVDAAWPTILLRIKVFAAGLVLVVAFRQGRNWRRGGLAALSGVRARAELTAALCGVTGLAWFVVIALMTQAGFSGNNRYLVIGSALIEVCGGVAWGWAGWGLGRLAVGTIGRISSSGARMRARAWRPLGILPRLIGRRPRHPAGGGRMRPGPPASALIATGVVAAGLVFALLPPWVGGDVGYLRRTHRSLYYQAQLRSGLTEVVAQHGGPGALLRCGTVMTEGFQVPMVAWKLDVHTLAIEAPPAAGAPPPPPPNVILQTRDTRSASLLPILHTWPAVRYVYLGHGGPFRLFEHCR